MSLLRQCGALVARQAFSAQHQTLLSASMLGLLEQRALLLPNATTGGAAACTCLAVRTHKKFGHKEEKTPGITKFLHYFAGTVFFVAIIDWRKVKGWIFPKVDADAGIEEPAPKKKNAKIKNDKNEPNETEESANDSEHDEVEEAAKKKTKPKEKVGFRERKRCAFQMKDDAASRK